MIFAVIFPSVILTQKGDCALLKKAIGDDFFSWSVVVFLRPCESSSRLADPKSSLFETFFRGANSFLKTLLRSYAFKFTARDHSAGG